jgi:hypothetical protein
MIINITIEMYLRNILPYINKYSNVLDIFTFGS